MKYSKEAERYKARRVYMPAIHSDGMAIADAIRRAYDAGRRLERQRLKAGRGVRLAPTAATLN